LPFTLKSILRQKKNYGNSNISPCKKIYSPKKSSERNHIPSRYYKSIPNLKFQHKAKISSFKHPHIKIDLLLCRGQNPLSYYIYSIMNLNTNILAMVGKGNKAFGDFEFLP
jgi:hypothetical protein